MGMSLPLQMTGVSQIGANQNFTARQQKSLFAAEQVILSLGGTTFAKTHLEPLSVSINSDPIQTFASVAHLENIAAYHGWQVGASDKVILNFYRDHINNPLEAEAFCLGMSNVMSLAIDGYIGAATAPQLKVVMKKSQINNVKRGINASVEDQNKLGTFSKTDHKYYPLVGAGVHEITTTPLEGRLQALHLITANDNITHVEAWLNDVRVWDLSAADMKEVVESAGRTVQTDTYHLDWELKNRTGDELPLEGANSFILKVHTSASDNIFLYRETAVNRLAKEL